MEKNKELELAIKILEKSNASFKHAIESLRFQIERNNTMTKQLEYMKSRSKDLYDN